MLSPHPTTQPVAVPLGSYPSYRPVELPLVDQLPSHWQIHKLRRLTRLIVSHVDKHIEDGQIPVRLCNYVDVYKNDFISSRMPFMAATATAEELRRFGLAAGDVVITKDSEDWRDIGVPAFVVSSAPDLVCGYHLAILRPPNGGIDGRFLFYVLQSPAVTYQFNVAATGVTRYGLSHAAIKDVAIALPPRNEQESIARYLAHIDGQIRRVTAACKQLVGLGRFLGDRKAALLYEYRTRLLEDVTTGKLDVREAARGIRAPELEALVDNVDTVSDGGVPEPTTEEDEVMAPEYAD